MIRREHSMRGRSGVLVRVLLAIIVPIASVWIRRQERLILARGVPLDAEQIATARAVGVAKPERVRVLRVDFVPMPRQTLVRRFGLRLRLLSTSTVGLTARYGIFIRADYWSDHALLIHELAHTAQYERLGGITPFLRSYLRECLVDGYPFGPLEREAANVSERLRV
jgi:hypothetical protein